MAILRYIMDYDTTLSDAFDFTPVVFDSKMKEISHKVRQKVRFFSAS